MSVRSQHPAMDEIRRLRAKAKQADTLLERIRAALNEVPEGGTLNWAQIAYLKTTVGCSG